ncbi:hypothetical protein BW731_11555 [Vagococcus martis]|uniref:Lysine transporter LysE n=1 Tax=Vagococcus martis TaxID=1768210 RepID=A0A1V4DK89_9ENTE|nr:LysE family translocator [Vagococcus martis]OPF88756.1 hypothetical protein BW731_11555 [Vagococcus martis]
MNNYLNFIFLTLVLVIIPGPDYILITKNTLEFGKLAGLKTLFGTCSALMCHTFLSIIGLSALLVKSAVLYSLVKYIGACYLIYLGVKSLLVKQPNNQTDAKPTKTNFYLQGLVTNLFNPKIAVFFLTFLPQFVDATNSSWWHFGVLGLTYIVVTFTIFGLYTLLLNHIRHVFEKDTTQNVINKSAGAILVFFGIKLILSD